MKKLTLILALIVGMCVPTSAQVDKNKLKSQANQKRIQQERAAEEARQRAENDYQSIIDDWDLSEYTRFLQNYPKNAHAREIKERVAEIQFWQNARNANTAEAYRNYLNSSKFNHFESEARDAMEALLAKEIDAAWTKANSRNTIEAYEEFISIYPEVRHAETARERIDNIRAEQEWQVLEGSNDVKALQQFIATYPNNPYANQARNKVNLITGQRYYDNGNKEDAYAAFKKVPENQVPYEYRNAYNDSREYYTFRRLNGNSDVADLLDFVQRYPQSQYANQVRNYVALSKANNFGYNSTEISYRDAESYATDDETRARVKSMARANEEAKKQHEADLRRQAKELKRASRKPFMSAERKENGGFLGLGIEFFDLSYNGRKDDGLVNYNVGLKLRLGNFKDRVQFGVGVKPGVGIWDFNGVYVPDKNGKRHPSTFFEMPVEAELRLNLTNGKDDDLQVFVAGMFEYNAVGKKEVQQPMGFRAGFGWATPVFDIFYYFGMGLGDIPKQYDYLGYYPNPFMEKKNQMNFGLNLMIRVPLY